MLVNQLELEDQGNLKKGKIADENNQEIVGGNPKGPLYEWKIFPLVHGRVSDFCKALFH